MVDSDGAYSLYESCKQELATFKKDHLQLWNEREKLQQELADLKGEYSGLEVMYRHLSTEYKELLAREKRIVEVQEENGWLKKDKEYLTEQDRRYQELLALVESLSNDAETNKLPIREHISFANIQAFINKAKEE